MTLLDVDFNTEMEREPRRKLGASMRRHLVNFKRIIKESRESNKSRQQEEEKASTLEESGHGG